MSQISIYDVVIPTFTGGLKTLDHILTKAQEFAKEKGLDADAVYPTARLIDDQLPLIFQVQNATRTVKTSIDRLTGRDSAPFENTEKTFDDLHARVRAALEFAEAASADELNAGGDRTISLSVKNSV